MLRDHRGARFKIDPRDQNEFNEKLARSEGNNDEFELAEGKYMSTFMDELMSKVPGKDGPDKEYSDESLGNVASG